MVNFADLRDARPVELATAAQAWSQLAGDMAKLEGQVVGEVTGPLRRSGWSGRAASSAFGVFDGLDDQCELAALQSRNLAAVMRAAATEFDDLHKQLLAAVSAATGELGLHVDERGLVHAPQPSEAELHDPDGQDTYRSKQNNAAIYEDLIRRIVSRADDADARFAQAMRNFGPHFAGQQVNTEWNNATADARAVLRLAGLSENDIPRPGTDPKQAAAWWRSLSDDQRCLLATAYPARIGALEGLPTVARDQANTLALRNLIGEPDLRTYNNDKSDPQYQRLVSLLDRLEQSETDPAAQQLYLLGIDNQGDGRAIVSMGNPDTARHTAVVVPGITTELDDMPGQINRAGNLQRTADDLTAGVAGDVAVIAWLGYDAPEIANAMGGGRAEQGAPLLDSFVNGLRASHEAGPSHVSVVGHSYGSTVVGTAASSGDGLAADDIIVAGSPGMRVDGVEDLKIDPRHVWAGAAQGDDVSGWMSHFAHNTEPHRDDFGANRFVVDTTGHSDYWKPDSESLRNQSRIIVGYYDRVGLEHGKAPQ